MKNKLLDALFLSTVAGIAVYFCKDYLRYREDQIIRTACGESNYERNHPKKPRKTT